MYMYVYFCELLCGRLGCLRLDQGVLDQIGVFQTRLVHWIGVWSAMNAIMKCDAFANGSLGCVRFAQCIGLNYVPLWNAMDQIMEFDSF